MVDAGVLGGAGELTDRAGGVGLKQTLHALLERITKGQAPQAFFAALCTADKPCLSVCNRSWRRGSIAYRCLVCEVDPSCAICPDCFQAGEHAGHDYRIVQAAGSCDCGDEDALSRTGFCPRHGAPLGDDGRPVYQPHLPPDVSADLNRLLSLCCRRLLADTVTALHGSAGDDEPEEAATPGGDAQAVRQLLLGARHGELRLVREALRKGASADTVDAQHHLRPTALHWAAQHGYVSVASVLLDAGASVRSENVFRQTALQVAVFEGHSKLVKLLLDRGADPAHSDAVFGSSLHIARHEAVPRRRAKTLALLEAAPAGAAAPPPNGLADGPSQGLPASSGGGSGGADEQPYGRHSGAVALELVRAHLSWLTELCKHGDSVREAIADAAKEGLLLRVLLGLRITCDRDLPVGPPGVPAGMAVAQPLAELDELCHSLLLFAPFKRALLSETLLLYPGLIGLSLVSRGEQIAPGAPVATLAHRAAADRAAAAAAAAAAALGRPAASRPRAMGTTGCSPACRCSSASRPISRPSRRGSSAATARARAR